jgi:hypothetical protein
MTDSNEREIDDILAKIIEVIPKDETELISNIKNFDTDLWNQAPELRNSYVFWNALRSALIKDIPVLDTPWKQQVSKIYNDAV